MLKNFVQILCDIVGGCNVLTQVDAMQTHLIEPRHVYQGQALAVVFPMHEEHIRDIVVACEKAGISITPQGGNTGMVGGQLSFDKKTIIMSMSRMNTIIHIDVLGKFAIVQSGVVLQNLHEALTPLGLFFPVHIGSQGSCQIGGLVSANAGGIHVLGHGTMRSQVFDLEAIIGGGKKIGSVKPLHKNNVGYDFKHFLIGAEGTLGIISRVCLRLKTIPKNRVVLMCSVNSPQDALDLYHLSQEELESQIDAFELMTHHCLELLRQHMPHVFVPTLAAKPYYILCEVVSNADNVSIDEDIENWLDTALKRHLIQDAIVAKNNKQSHDLWLMRHSISHVQRCAGRVVSHDIAVPIGSIGDFIECVEKRLIKRFKDIIIIDYGHLGDGNLHYNVIQPMNIDEDTFLSHCDVINDIVYKTVIEYNGTISAEHGIGIQKKNRLSMMKTDDELALMRGIKSVMDPCHVFNPGKIFT